MSSPDVALELALRRAMMRRARDTVDHPVPEELRRYLLGELEASRRERLQDHLASCRSCARILLEMGSFAQDAEAAPARDPRAERAWRRLKRHLKPPRRAAGPAHVTRRPARSARHRLAWAMSLAALMAMATTAALWLVRDGDRPTADVIVSDLVPENDVAREVEGRPANRVGVQGERWVWILNSEVLPESTEHRLEIFDAEGRRRWRSGPMLPGAYGSFAVELPGDYLEPGHYRLVLSVPGPGGSDADGAGSADEAPVATYRVQVTDSMEHEEEP